MTKESKLLRHIYYAALHHRDLNELLKNDLSRDDVTRGNNTGRFEAYDFIVRMITHSDTIGKADYKKTFKMEDTFPTIY